MQGLFSPAIAVMNRLNYGKKNLLLSILSLLAILVVIASLFQNLVPTIHKLQLELDGVQRLKATTLVLNKLQKYRGLSMAVMGGLEQMRGRQTQVEGEADRAIAKLTEALADDVRERFDYAAIPAGWQQVRQLRGGKNLEGIFTEHSRLIERVLQLHTNLADQALLLTDSEPDTYHLIRLLSEELPEVLEKICQLRDRSISGLAEKKSTADQRMLLLFAKNNIDLQAAKIENILVRTVQFNPALEAPLFLIRDSLHNSSLDIEPRSLSFSDPGTRASERELGSGRVFFSFKVATADHRAVLGS